MRQNALCGLQIPPDAERQVHVMCPNALFMETASGPLEHKKYCVDVARLGHTGMHYVTHKSHRMQKHKFVITCLGALFIETSPGPPVHEK
jgi:hypothetical protein